MIPLNNDWNLVTAWGEECTGSSWRNDIVWALVARAGTSEYKMLCLQPSEQTPQVMALVKISHTINQSMCAQVAGLLMSKVKEL
jgi:hypothetical protein